MSFGPVELLAVKFPGNHFSGEIVPALQELVDKKIIRIVDLLFVTKDTTGAVTRLELADTDAGTYAAFDPLVDDVAGLVSDEDVEEIANMLEPNSSAGLLLFEHIWTQRFRDAVLKAHGQLMLDEHIPSAVVEQVETSHAMAVPIENAAYDQAPM